MVFRIPLYLVFCALSAVYSGQAIAQNQMDLEGFTVPQPEYTPPTSNQPVGNFNSPPPTQPVSGDPTPSAISPAMASPPRVPARQTPPSQPATIQTNTNNNFQDPDGYSCAAGKISCQVNGLTMCFDTQQECNSAKKPPSCQETCEGLNDGGFCYRKCRGENPCGDGKHLETLADGVEGCIADDNGTPPAANTGTAPEKCEKALNDVSDVCKLDNNSDIQQIMQVSKQFSSGMANNAVTACTDIGKLASSANMAMFGFESKCQAEYKDCTDACSENNSENKTQMSSMTDKEKSEFKATLREKSKQCKKYSQQVKPSELDAQRAMQSQVTNSCDNLLAKLGMDCLRNPSGPGCSSLKINPGDCKNPANISNQVCLCINNPAACSNLSKGLANLPGGNGGIEGDGGGTGPGGIGAGLPGGALSLGDDMIGLEGKGGFSGVNTGAGGGRGGGGYGSGDSASGGRGKPGLAMKTGPETNIYKGNYGGGAAFGGPGGSGGGAGYRDQNGQAVPKGSVVDKNGRIRPDFSKFYPNMKYDPGRGLAGVSGPDGITGPATNLFNKVNNQFRSQAKTFLP